MRAASVFILAILLSGCLASTYVSSIGARELKGEFSVVGGKSLTGGSLQEYKRRLSAGHFQLPFPYKTLKAGPSIGDPIPATLDTRGIHESRGGGVYLVPINGNLFAIDSFRPDGGVMSGYLVEDDLYVRRTYRAWWGYPAQGFQALALPVDAVLCPLFFLTVGVVSVIDR